MEWFTSRTLRESAAIEQREAICQGPADLLHRDGRHYLHRTIATALREHGDMKTDVLADQGVLVKRMPDVAILEQDTADRPRALGEVLAEPPSPLRGFLISEEDEDKNQ
ncbi:hypothetical protein [Streptomyces sp. NPDC051561]|uniref:hypothetical protein n=1 Tax=Streptomyces sp. NPDC051561 TaxID=3365658 RepID=UPI003788E808